MGKNIVSFHAIRVYVLIKEFFFRLNLLNYIITSAEALEVLLHVVVTE